MSYTLKQLAEKIGAKVHGDESYVIHSLATLSNANAQQIAFLANKKYSQQLSVCNSQSNHQMVLHVLLDMVLRSQL